MSDKFDEREAFFTRRTDKTIISKRITDAPSGEKVRIASHIIAGEPGLMFATVKDEIVLRRTPAGRYEIKATFLEDDRHIQTLTIQRYSGSIRTRGTHFSFVGSEIDTLINFIAGVKTIPLEGPPSSICLTRPCATSFLTKAKRAASSRKIRSYSCVLRNRRTSHATSLRLAIDGSSCSASSACSMSRAISPVSRSVSDVGPEAVWQEFFEANTWIFGYGLTYQFLSQLDERKLEQIVRGPRSDRGRQALGRNHEDAGDNQLVVLRGDQAPRYAAARAQSVSSGRVAAIGRVSRRSVAGANDCPRCNRDPRPQADAPQTTPATQLVKSCSTSNPVRALSSARLSSFRPTEGSTSPSSAPSSSTGGTRGDRRSSRLMNSSSGLVSSLSMGPNSTHQRTAKTQNCRARSGWGPWGAARSRPGTGLDKSRDFRQTRACTLPISYVSVPVSQGPSATFECLDR